MPERDGIDNQVFSHRCYGRHLTVAFLMDTFRTFREIALHNWTLTKSLVQPGNVVHGGVSSDKAW